MKVSVSIVMVVLSPPESPFSRNTTLYQQEFDWPAVPRVGDQFLLDDEPENGGGWSVEVEKAEWSNLGCVNVDLGEHSDNFDEGLEEVLVEHGWKKFGNEEDKQ